MVIIALLGAVLFLALIFGPQAWIRATMQKHGVERADFPGTGGELARHILDKAGLSDVKVERIASGDHYSSTDRVVRLSASNFDGRSVTAVAVAAHEASHALQHAEGYGPLMLRQKLAGHAIIIQRAGSILMMATPVIFALTRSPVVLLGGTLGAIGIMLSTVVIHAVTLPTEFNASFKRALPMLESYIPPEDMPGAHSVLKAAAFTYVASALVTLLDISRWLRVLRF
ncbi:zinc metallopeptidase [Aestuariivirga sp.]|uniref:zinc metallopeptidase n=1 Tax=Aestuariivirga sp. TaxID=2650926 RepID=UPI003592EBC5